jgi:hypothetical protein
MKNIKYIFDLNATTLIISCNKQIEENKLTRMIRLLFLLNIGNRLTDISERELRAV